MKTASAQVSLFILCLGLTSAFGQPTLSVTWKPPVIPFSLTVDSSGAITPRLTDSYELPTPLGTISGSLGYKTIKKEHAYFLVRHKRAETCYCIGRKGRIRLLTQGKHEIQISTHYDYSNVIILDLQSFDGTIDLEFIPDDTTDELARVHGGYVDLVLRKNGTLIFDAILDTEVPRGDISKVVFADLPKDKRMVVSVDFSSGGKRQWMDIESEEDHGRIEALWLNACLEMNKITSTYNTVLCNAYGKDLNVFVDGSILFRHGVHLGEGMFVSSEQYVPKEFIKELQLDGGAWYNYYTQTLKIGYVYPLCGKDNSFTLLDGERLAKPFFLDARKRLDISAK
jgi:hypothetical protein